MFKEIYLTEKDLAKKWGLSPKTLQSWRWRNVGPPYLKIGGRIRYTSANIKNFEENNLHNSTSHSSNEDSSCNKILLTL